MLEKRRKFIVTCSCNKDSTLYRQIEVYASSPGESLSQAITQFFDELNINAVEPNLSEKDDSITIKKLFYNNDLVNFTFTSSCTRKK